MTTPDRERDARELDERLAELLNARTGSTDTLADPQLKSCRHLGFRGGSYPSMGGVVLLSPLGRGGMASVYFGHHTRLDVEVAVKVISRETMQRSPQAVSRFVQEARLAARLKSDHLVQVYDVDEDEETGLFFIVMEFVRGSNAADWAAEEGVVHELDALDLCLAATRGLETAHAHEQAIVHRDVKPGNLLVPTGSDGSPDVKAVKLADLGLAKFEDDGPGWTRSDMGMGTPGYMAPEQVEDVKQATKSADVFGMGATLYALLCGSAPFDGPSAILRAKATLEGRYLPLQERRSDVGASTCELIARCLQVDPSKRFADASALRIGLEACRSDCMQRLDREVEATVPTGFDTGKDVREPRARRPYLAWLALFVVAAVVVASSTIRDRASGTDRKEAATAGPMGPAARSEPVAERPDPVPLDEVDASTLVERPSVAQEPRGLEESAEVITPAPPARFEGFEEPAELASAAQPFVTHRERLVIRGRLASFDSERYLLRLGSDEVVVGTDGRFRGDLDLGGEPEATYSVALELIERGTGEVVESRTLTCVVDRTAPTVTIASPSSETSWSRERRVGFRGRVEDQNVVTLTVAAEPVEVGSDGSFEHVLELEPGVRVCRVQASDASGNEHFVERTVRVDVVPPLLEVAEPVVLPDGGGWSIVGTLVDLEPHVVRCGEVEVECGPDGRFELSVAAQSTVTLFGVDRAGNRSDSRTLTLPLDQRPPVLELEPFRPDELRPKIVLAGSVDEPATIDVVELDPESDRPIGRSLQVLAHAVSAAETPSWRFEFRPSEPLGLGEQRAFRLVPRDVQGNHGAESKVTLRGPVQIGLVREILTERRWVVIDSAERHRELLEAVKPGHRAVLGNGHLVEILSVRDGRRDRGLTAIPDEGFAIADFAGLESQPVYLFIPQVIETSGR